jgi:hypothetical protein
MGWLVIDAGGNVALPGPPLGPTRTPPPSPTPPGVYCPFFMTPVIAIIDP